MNMKLKLNRKNIKLSIIFLFVSMITIKVIYDMNSNKPISAKEEYEYLKETMSLSSIVNHDDYVVQRINEKYRNSNIEVYYPATKYDILNKEINGIIDGKINKFISDIKDDTEYSMFINFDMYKYNDNYISFLFHVLIDYAGAHPNTYLFTVNYNIKEKNIVNIDSLIKKNNNILNLMSKYSYNTLLNNDKIKEIKMINMLEAGTKPTKDNFDAIVYTKNGLIVFFEKYQIAPYAYGEFWITIPYEELNLKVND